VNLHVVAEKPGLLLDCSPLSLFLLWSPLVEAKMPEYELALITKLLTKVSVDNYVIFKAPLLNFPSKNVTKLSF